MTDSHAGNARGQKRRPELLQFAVDYLLEEGLQDFSVRQVALRAGTSHRILLYHFETSENLLREALAAIRTDLLAERIGTTPDPLEAIMAMLGDESPAGRVLVQSVLQAGIDPERYGDIGRDYVDAYMPLITAHVPEELDSALRDDIAALVLCACRGAILDRRSTGEPDRGQRAVGLLLGLLQSQREQLLAAAQSK